MTYRKSKGVIRDCTAECGRGPRSFDTPSLLEIGCYWNVHDRFVLVDVLLNQTAEFVTYMHSESFGRVLHSHHPTLMYLQSSSTPPPPPHTHTHKQTKQKQQTTNKNQTKTNNNNNNYNNNKSKTNLYDVDSVLRTRGNIPIWHTPFSPTHPGYSNSPIRYTQFNPAHSDQNTQTNKTDRHGIVDSIYPTPATPDTLAYDDVDTV